MEQGRQTEIEGDYVFLFVVSTSLFGRQFFFLFFPFGALQLARCPLRYTRTSLLLTQQKDAVRGP